MWFSARRPQTQAAAPAGGGKTRYARNWEGEKSKEERVQERAKRAAHCCYFLSDPSERSGLLNIKRKWIKFFFCSQWQFFCVAQLHLWAIRLKSRNQYLKSDSNHLHLSFSFAEPSIEDSRIVNHVTHTPKRYQKPVIFHSNKGKHGNIFPKAHTRAINAMSTICTHIFVNLLVRLVKILLIYCPLICSPTPHWRICQYKNKMFKNNIRFRQ